MFLAHGNHAFVCAYSILDSISKVSNPMDINIKFCSSTHTREMDSSTAYIENRAYTYLYLYTVHNYTSTFLILVCIEQRMFGSRRILIIILGFRKHLQHCPLHRIQSIFVNSNVRLLFRTPFKIEPLLVIANCFFRFWQVIDHYFTKFTNHSHLLNRFRSKIILFDRFQCVCVRGTTDHDQLLSKNKFILSEVVRKIQIHRVNSQDEMILLALLILSQDEDCMSGSGSNGD